MILIPREKHAEAQNILLQKGFQQQHSRIFHYLLPESDVQYHCTLGFEDGDEGTFEVNISLMRRPIAKKQKGIRVEDVQVISVDQAPQQMQDVLADVEEQLEQL